MGGFLDFWISAARYTPQQIVQMQLTVAFYRYCLAVKAPVSVLLSMHQSLFQRLKSVLLDLTAAIAFYTCLPVPIHWTLNFQRVACWVPVVGLLIGGLLGLLDWTLALLHLPILTRSALVILLGVALTGGLHLDGAMDTADGLAVMDPQHRLQVMADSHTGAFGAMAAIALLLLKTAALTDLSSHRWLALVLAAGWGRWAQQVAIARYPYLKPTGKGAFHKTVLRSFRETLPGLFLLCGISGAAVGVDAAAWRFSLSAVLGGGAIALLVPAWFHRKLGGHTGDTYGAVVEWTEALLLVLFTLIGAISPT